MCIFRPRLSKLSHYSAQLRSVGLLAFQRVGEGERARSYVVQSGSHEPTVPLSVMCGAMTWSVLCCVLGTCETGICLPFGCRWSPGECIVFVWI